MAQYKSEFLNIMHERGFIHQCSDFAGLDKKLCEEVRSAYVGYDATAPSLHVGNLISIMMLHWFQQAGHKPVTLMGGGTSKVGDPSGKDESRKLLTEDGIAKNIESIKRVFSNFLKYGDGKTDAIMVNNADWLEKLNYIEFLRDYGTHFTINRMLTFDSVKLRLEREQPLTFLEFNYMILQAFDFVKLREDYGVILQMGGSDQWGNIINGVELWRRMTNSEMLSPHGVEPSHTGFEKGLELAAARSTGFDPIFALTTPLLTTASGAKMGKSASGAVWLNADMLKPYDYFQYWRNTEDADVGRFLRLYTTMKLDEIAKLEKLQGQEINEAKRILAFEATKLCHGEAAAKEAMDTAQKVFEQGGVGEDLPVVYADLKKPVPFIDLLVQAGLAPSKGEARRLVQGGGAKCNDQPVTDAALTVSNSNLTSDGYIKLSAGKKRHALVKVK